MAVLHKAIEERRYNQVMLILRYGTDIHYQDEEGLTALMKCCRLGELRTAHTVAKMLVDCGADAGQTDNKGRHALHHAVLHQRTQLAKLFLLSGDININQKDCNGDTVLQVATRVGNTDIVKAVVKYMKRYDVTCDVRDVEGLTPLMRACKAGHLDIARVLVNEGGASLTMRDNESYKTPLELLQTSLIIPNGIDPFHCDPNLLHHFLKVQHEQKVPRIRSAQVRSRPNSTQSNSSRRSVKRASSAPIRRQILETSISINGRPVTPHINGWISPFESTEASQKDPCHQEEKSHKSRYYGKTLSDQTESCKEQFVPLYQVYSIQNSASYRPSARKPSPPPPTPEPPPSPKSPRSPKLNAKNKLQKFLRLKRAESIVKAFTGRQQRSMSVAVPSMQQKNQFQQAIMASLRRRSTKSEALDANLLSPDLKDRYGRRRSSTAKTLLRADSNESVNSSSDQHSPRSEREASFAQGVRRMVRMRKLGVGILNPPVLSVTSEDE